MSIPGLLIALILSLIALAVVARPLLRPARREPTAEEGRLLQGERLARYYERALTNIRDLDEDYSTGKISELAYTTEREVWVARGIRLLRALDRIERDGAAGDDADEIERAIDEAVAAYRDRARPAHGDPAAGDRS
ncbi:MAG: hypothetical protein OXG85_16035 [Chloroflexi bacterium]|nr:hypothetical protein [Chloroflexota bacterium]